MANGVTILPSQRGFCAHTVVLGLSCSAAGTPPARPQRTVVADELVSHSRLDLLPVDGGRGAPQTAADQRQLHLPTPAGTESAHFHCSEREQSASTCVSGGPLEALRGQLCGALSGEAARIGDSALDSLGRPWEVEPTDAQRSSEEAQARWG